MTKLARAVPFVGTFGAAPLPDRVAASLRVEEQEGLRLAAKVRIGLLAVAFVWLGHDLFHVGWAAVFNLATAGAVLASGLAEFAILKRHRHPRGIAMAFALFDSVVLGAVLALLVPDSAPQVTENGGGTSKGDPNAGANSNDFAGKLRRITAGDKAGASFLTILVLGAAVGTFGWMSMGTEGDA